MIIRRKEKIIERVDLRRRYRALGVKARRISGFLWPETERQMGGVGTEEKWNAIVG